MKYISSNLSTKLLLASLFVGAGPALADPLATYVGTDPRSGKGCTVKLGMDLRNNYGSKQWAAVTGPAYHNTQGRYVAIGERTITNTSASLNEYDGREYCIYHEPALIKLKQEQLSSLLHVCVKFSWSKIPLSARVQVTPVRANFYTGRSFFAETLPVQYSLPFTEVNCEKLRELK